MNRKPTVKNLYQSMLNKSKTETNIIALIDKGAPVEFIKTGRNIIQQQPLHLAASKGYIHVVQKLLDAGANPNTRSIIRLPPITNALAEGHLDVAKLLVARGANINGLRVITYRLDDDEKETTFLTELLLSSHEHLSTTIRYYSELIPINEILETKKTFQDLYAKEQTPENKELLEDIEGIYIRRRAKNAKNNTMKEHRRVYYNAPPLPIIPMGGPGYQEAKESWERHIKTRSGGRKNVYRTRTRRLYK
jgi:hypothetical protein